MPADKPNNVKSKKLKPGCPCSIKKLSTMRLVDVPTSVTVPPNIAAYDSGIRSFDGACNWFCFIGPIKLATIAVLLSKAEDENVSTNIFQKLLANETLMMARPNRLIKVVLSIELLTTSSKIRATRPWLVRFTNTSEKLSCWLSSNTKTLPENMLDGRFLVKMSAIIVRTKTSNTILC